jgi:hypothetical protein
MPINCDQFYGRELAMCKASTGQAFTGAPVVPPQQVFARINSKGETEIGFTRGVITYPLTGKTDPAVERVNWVLRPDGSARQTIYVPTQWGLPPEVREYTPSEFELLRVFGSLGGVSPIPKSGEWNAEWAANMAPFTDADRKRAVDVIRNLSAAEVLAIYYSLYEIIPPKVGQCGSIKRLEITTPPQASDDRGYGLFQGPIMAAIYKLRPELREIYDPTTGKSIPGLLPPDQLPQIPCLVSKSKFDVWADVLLSVVSLGFPGPTWVGAINTIVQSVDQIRSMKDAIGYQKQMAELSAKITGGAVAIMQAPPKPPGQLSQAEKDLLAKASGETKSPTGSSGEAVGSSSGIPWLLIAGAAAALLS